MTDIVERLRNEIPCIGDDRALSTTVPILDLATAADEIVALRKRVEELKAKIKLLDSALLLAFPNGAGGGVFELWNEARKST